MANPEHLKILMQGVETWNKWRSRHPNAELDLRGADLNGVELRGVDLHAANLSGVDFSGARLNSANFSGADLSGAHFSITNLAETDFGGANLNGAHLYAATLLRARLNGADIRAANLSSANLSAADVHSAKALGTIFVNVDLRGVKGLESVKHYGRSEISISTIYRSKGLIPEAFLRGCGVPEDFITFMPSLTANAIEFYSCFLSYSSKDQEFADRLYADLQEKGVRCWFAPEDLKIGDRFRDRIDESIRLHDKLLLILSENSVLSPWVGDEVEAAMEREHREKRIVLFPIRIDEAVTEAAQAWAAAIRRTRHIGDFTNWKSQDAYRRAFDRLLRDLKAET